MGHFDIGTLRGVITAVLLLLFLWLIVWAYSGSRRKDFDAAARLPLEDEPLQKDLLHRKNGQRP